MDRYPACDPAYEASQLADLQAEALAERIAEADERDALMALRLAAIGAYAQLELAAKGVRLPTALANEGATQLHNALALSGWAPVVPA